MAALVDASGAPASDADRMIGRLRMELRCGEMWGRAAPDPRGLLVWRDLFLGGREPTLGSITEVVWRVGQRRYEGLAPVLAYEHQGIVIGAVRRVRAIETVREVDWRMFFVDARRCRPPTGAHRIRYADDEYLRIVVPATVPAINGDRWFGHVREGDRLMQIAAEVRGSHRLAADGRRIAVLRWKKASHRPTQRDGQVAHAPW